MQFVTRILESILILVSNSGLKKEATLRIWPSNNTFSWRWLTGNPLERKFPDTHSQVQVRGTPPTLLKIHQTQADAEHGAAPVVIQQRITVTTEELGMQAQSTGRATCLRRSERVQPLQAQRAAGLCAQ